MPGFLKRAEQKLLLNKPGIWSTRAHLVLYYGILFLILLTILCFLEPNDPKAPSTTEIWTGFVSIISGIGFIVWLIYLLRFNVFKKYGIIHPLHGLVTFLLFFISTGVLVSFAYVHPVMESVRANMAYSDEEIVKDINDINVKIFQLEYDLLKEPWQYDRAQLVDSPTQEGSTGFKNYDPVTNEYIPHYRLDSVGFYKKISAADSLVKLKDSVYLVYSTPDYSLLSPYLYYSQAKAHLLTDFEIFHKVHGHLPSGTEREAISRELKVLLEKYTYYRYKRYYQQIDEKDTPKEKIEKKYRLENIDSSIGHIMEKKYRWSDDDKFVFIRIFYYVTLSITLLIFIFRHTSIRTFFLSILAGVLLAIFTAMIMSFLRAEGIHFLSCMIIYIFFFFFGSLTVWSAKKRNAVTGIMINLFVFMVTTLPVLLLGWFYQYQRYQLFNGGWRVLTTWDFEDYAIYAEVAGALLLIALLATYITKLYRRWFALPED